MAKRKGSMAALLKEEVENDVSPGAGMTRLSGLIKGDITPDAPAVSIPNGRRVRERIEATPPDKRMKRDSLTMEAKDVTPLDADVWIRSAATNRPVNHKRVKQYAEMMIRGQWIPNHPQGLIFNKEGRLIEGQHRLLAWLKAAPVIEQNQEDERHQAASEGRSLGHPSSLSMGFVCILGADADVQIALDAGQTRAIHQTGQIIGLDTTPMAVAICKALWIDPRPSNGKIPRITDYNKVFKAYESFRDGVVIACKKHNGRNSVTVAAIRAVVARAYYRCNGDEDIERLKRFVYVLDTGLATDASEHPAVLLRNAYLQMGKRGEKGNLELHRKAMWALDAYMDKKEVSTLRQAKKQLFPLESFEPDEDDQGELGI